MIITPLELNASGFHTGDIELTAVERGTEEYLSAKGKDITYLHEWCKAKLDSEEVYENLAKIYADRSEEQVSVEVFTRLSWMREDDQDKIIRALMDETFYLSADEFWEDIEHLFIEQFSPDHTRYQYEGEGYVLEMAEGSIEVHRGPHYTMVDGTATYCLGPEWFADDKAPYEVYDTVQTLPMAA